MYFADQIKLIELQCDAFREKGIQCNFSTRNYGNSKEAVVKIMIPISEKDTKTYNFCDPDWNVVTLQLATLYVKVLNHERAK